jgi:hypothetical protein
VVGVFFYDTLELVGVGIILARIIEVKEDVCPLILPLGLFDGITALTVADPFVGFFLPCLPGNDFHFVGHHKNGIKTYTELANEVGVFLGFSCELLEEIFGAAPGYGPQVSHQVLFVHPIPLSEMVRVLFFSSKMMSTRGSKFSFLESFVRQGQILEFVQSIG